MAWLSIIISKKQWGIMFYLRKYYCVSLYKTLLDQNHCIKSDLTHISRNIKYNNLTNSFYFRRETLPLSMGRLWMEICSFWWVNPSPSQAYRSKTFQMFPMRTKFFTIWSSCVTYEETSDIGFNRFAMKQRLICRIIFCL